jgi:hypothetical protein
LLGFVVLRLLLHPVVDRAIGDSTAALVLLWVVVIACGGVYAWRVGRGKGWRFSKRDESVDD